MARRLRKNRSIRMSNAEWGELVKAAGYESSRRPDPVDPGTLARELTLRAARRINARAAMLSARPEMAVA